VRLVRLELGVAVSAPALASSRATRVEIVCDGSKVAFAISDPQTGKRLTRSMALTARTENVATRMIALAVSELVLASWVDLTDPAPAVPAGATAPPPLELRLAAPGPAERQIPPPTGTAYVLLLGQATGPFSGVGLGWGGGFRIGWTAGRHWMQIGKGTITGHPAVDLDLTGAWANVDSSLGTIRVSMWSVSPRASFRLRRGPAWLDLGAGARFGLAQIEGAPLDSLTTQGRTLVGTWAGPAGYLGAGLRLRRLVMAAGIEAGYVLRSVAALVDDGAPVSISGHWLSGSVALGWGP
jgi:hypothetical protein